MSQPLLVAEALQAAGGVIQPLTLVVRPGDRIGLLSASGRELSMFLRTLARLQRPSEGRLFWSGVDVTRRPRALLPRHLREGVLLLWANPYALFQDGTRVGAAIGRSGATSATPEGRLRASGLSSALLEFGIGSLSGLERVRVALTYAQRHRPSVILVDDVFAHLIPESWRGLLATLEAVVGETGALIVASRYTEALGTMTRVIDLSAAGKVNAES
ncbi:MAG: hypothetical protein MUF84_18365 [Anaerolineae bacterium]|nr:hypothetical protein [Anaerolineae bacterium]